jgi:hypothetical protein
MFTADWSGSIVAHALMRISRVTTHQRPSSAISARHRQSALVKTNQPS